MYISIQNQNQKKCSIKHTKTVAATPKNTCTNVTVLFKSVLANIATAFCIPMNSVSLVFAACNALNSKISFLPKNSKLTQPTDAFVKISSASKCIAAVIDKEESAIPSSVNAKAVKMIQMDCLTEKRKKFSLKFANNILSLRDKTSICTRSVRTKSQSIPQVTPL